MRKRKGRLQNELQPAFGFRSDANRSGKQSRDVFGFDEFSRLVQVIVDNRLRVDAERVVHRREQFSGMDRITQRG